MENQLQTMFDLQKQLNLRLIRQRGLEDISDEVWIQRQTLAMLSELAELLDEVNFKWWKNKKPRNPDALRNELVDIFHFFLSMCISAGMDAEELYARYCAKNQENHLRQEGLSEKTGYAVAEMGSEQP